LAATPRCFSRKKEPESSSPAAAKPKARETIDLIRGAGGEGIFVPTDVSKTADVQALVQKTVEKFGRLDIGFNNAGIEGNWIPIAEQPEEDFDRNPRHQPQGCLLCLKYEIQKMLKQGTGGAIVNMSSVAGFIGSAGAATYCATKHGRHRPDQRRRP